MKPLEGGAAGALCPLKLDPEVVEKERAAEFDEKIQAVLKPYSLNGQLSYEVTARIVWGKPTVA